MVVMDSSGWIEFFIDGPRADAYARHLKDLAKVITPTIVLYEVYKKIRRDKTEEEALSAISLIQRTAVKPLSESIALFAADLSILHSLPMADAVVYATAIEEGCKVVTGDAHFKGLSNVLFIE